MHIAGVCRLAGEREELLLLFFTEAGENVFLQVPDMRAHIIEQGDPDIRQAQRAGTAIFFTDRAFDQALLFQAIDHAADRGAVIGDRSGKRCLIDTGICFYGA